VISVPKCVLIVDDHVAVRKALRSLFNLNGLTVCGEAVNGRDAIEKAMRLHPDLIVLDLSMPVMDGLEAARELTKLLPDIPLMMFTNHVSHLMELNARSAGIWKVISKNEPYEGLMYHARKFLSL